MTALSGAESDRGAYSGWIAGWIVIIAILAIGTVLWLRYHP